MVHKYSQQNIKKLKKAALQHKPNNKAIQTTIFRVSNMDTDKRSSEKIPENCTRSLQMTQKYDKYKKYFTIRHQDSNQ